MGPSPLSSVRLGGGSALSARRSIADAACLRIKPDVRKCKRRLVPCAKAAPKATGRPGFLKLGGSGKKPASKKRGGAGDSRTVQLRRGSDTVKVAKPRPQRRGRRDPRTVFVAGATGRLGCRVVRTLLEAGLKVVAGARDIDAAQEIFAEALTNQQARRVRIVPFNLSDEDVIASAIGNAGKVVSALGASGSDLYNPCGPRNVDGVGTSNLIRVATDLGVEQFILVSSIGTGKFGWPASSTNIFWGILSWKRTAEVALEQSGMVYTIIRPGGIERAPDTYKETHNVTLSTRDQLFAGQVSRLQVAELIAACCTNPRLSQNKTLEVIADSDAPKLGYPELLAGQPEEVSQEERLKAKERAAQIQRDIAAAEKRIESLKKTSQDLGERAATLQARVSEFKSAERSVASNSAATQRAAAKVQRELDSLRAKANALAQQEAAARAVLTALQKAGRSGKLLTKQEQDAIALPILQPELAKRKAEEAAQAAAAAEAKAQALVQKKASVAAVAPSLQKGVDQTTKVVAAKPKKIATAVPKAAKASPPPIVVQPQVTAKGAELTAMQKAKADREAKRQAEEKLRAELVARLESEQQAVVQAAEESRKKAELEAKEKAIANTASKAKAAAAAKIKQSQAATAARKAEAEKKKAELEAKAKAEEKARLEAEAEAQRVAQLEEEKRLKAQAEEEAKKRKEAEEKAKADELRKKKEAIESAKAAKIAERKAAAEAKAKAAAEAKAKAAAAAAAKRAAAGSGGGWTWPWATPSAPPEPEELVQRRKEAQAWIAAWRARTENGVPGETVDDAQEWIRKWRANNLEEQLPE